MDGVDGLTEWWSWWLCLGVCGLPNHIMPSISSIHSPAQEKPRFLFTGIYPLSCVTYPRTLISPCFDPQAPLSDHILCSYTRRLHCHLVPTLWVSQRHHHTKYCLPTHSAISTWFKRSWPWSNMVHRSWYACFKLTSCPVIYVFFQYLLLLGRIPSFTAIVDLQAKVVQLLFSPTN